MSLEVRLRLSSDIREICLSRGTGSVRTKKDGGTGLRVVGERGSKRAERR